MSGRDWKKHIDIFIGKNWKFIEECANNIMKGKKNNAGDLLGELCLFLYEQQDKVVPYCANDNSLKAFCLSWMKLQAQYASTPFNRKYTPNAQAEEMPDVPATDETVPEDEYIQDLRRVYTDEQVDKILKIHDIYPGLSKVHKILFQAYFIEGLSYDKIKDRYDFYRTDKNGKKIHYKSKKSIYNLMKELKDEIKKNL